MALLAMTALAACAPGSGVEDYGTTIAQNRALKDESFRSSPDSPIPPDQRNVLLPLAYYAMMIANFWLGWPFMTVVATGALQSIPQDLYEAAGIDGASGAQQFWRVTVPLLRPAMVPAAIYGFTLSFNLFSFVYFMTGGGPEHIETIEVP